MQISKDIFVGETFSLEYFMSFVLFCWCEIMYNFYKLPVSSLSCGMFQPFPIAITLQMAVLLCKFDFERMSQNVDAIFNFHGYRLTLTMFHVDTYAHIR